MPQAEVGQPKPFNLEELNLNAYLRLWRLTLTPDAGALGVGEGEDDLKEGQEGGGGLPCDVWNC